MAELITNGDFSSGDTGWTLTGSADTSSESIWATLAGMSQPYLYFGVAAATAKQDSIFTEGSTYTVSFTGVYLNGTISIYNGSGKDQLIAQITETSTVNYSVEITAEASDG